MLSGLERHISVVSLLLVAGAGLILLEGPVGSRYLHQVPAENQMEKDAPMSADALAAPDPGKSVARTMSLAGIHSTWAAVVDTTSPLPTGVTTKFDPTSGPK